MHPLETNSVMRSLRLPASSRHTTGWIIGGLLLAQGVSPRVVMKTLGHSQVSLTLNTNSHVLPALQREPADKMNAILGG